jgi:hypothetical protein
MSPDTITDNEETGKTDSDDYESELKKIKQRAVSRRKNKLRSTRLDIEEDQIF